MPLILTLHSPSGADGRERRKSGEWSLPIGFGGLVVDCHLVTHPVFLLFSLDLHNISLDIVTMPTKEVSRMSEPAANRRIRLHAKTRGGCGNCKLRRVKVCE